MVGPTGECWVASVSRMEKVDILIRIIRFAHAGIRGYLQVNRRIQEYADEHGLSFDEAWTEVWDAAQEAGEDRVIAYLMLIKAYRRLFIAVASFLRKRRKTVPGEDEATSADASSTNDEPPGEIALRETLTAAAQEGGVPVADVLGLTRDLRTLRKHYPVPPQE